MSPAPPTSARRHRFHLLDALRGIAALLVIPVHLPRYMQLRFAPMNDFLAVDFFFCLSGFVLAHSYQRRLGGAMTIPAFLRARILRLYPVYLLGTVLGLSWAITVDHQSFRSSLIPLGGLGLLLLPNLSTRLSPFLFPLDFPAWSLFFELSVNLAFAVLARARAAKGWFLALCSAASAGAVAHWLLQGQHLGDLGWSSRPDWFGFAFARATLSFAAGLVLYRLYRARRANPVHLRGTAARMLLVPGSLVFLLRAPFRPMQTAGFQLLCIALLFPLLVLVGAHCRLPHNLNRTCAVLGELSYPLYLLPVPLLRILGSRRVTLFAVQHPGAVIPLVAFAMLLAVLLSYATARLYDAPLRRHLSRPNARPLAVPRS